MAANEDFLNEDPEVPGQKFCLLSFLSPEKVLADKDIFYFSKFLEQYEFNVRVQNLEKYLVSTMNTFNDKLEEKALEFEKKDLSGCAVLCRNSRFRIDTTMDTFQTFVKDNQKEMTESKLKEQYEDFNFKNKSKLEEAFFAKNDFRTTVRGLKIRGVYGSRGEAEARSKKLQRADTLHNIFLGEVGKWLPWDPAPTEVNEQEYAEEQLNNLMKKYKENEDSREMFMRENRNRMRGSGPTHSVSRVDGEEPAPSNAAANEYNSMFSGPADLAMQRKMEKE